MKSLAAILVKQKAPLELIEIEVPAPGKGQVLVKLTCTGVCGSQIGEIDGVKGPDRFLPHLLGHEGSGQVVECGEGVSTVKESDHVVLHWRKGSGLEGVPPKYESKLGTINAGWITTFNEFALISENRATAVPPMFDPEIAALLGCAVTTGFGVVRNNAKLKQGESIGVFGAGGVGLSVIQAAALAGAEKIIATDIHQNRLELADKLGATHLLDASKADVEKEVRDIVGAAGLDVAVENTGNVRVIEMAYELTSAQGRTILVGVPPKGSKATIYTLPLHFGRVLTGSHGGDAMPEHDVPEFVEICEQGSLDFSLQIGKRYKLRDINDAIDDMRSGAAAGRCMIHM